MARLVHKIFTVTIFLFLVCLMAAEGVEDGLCQGCEFGELEASFLYWKTGGNELDYGYDLVEIQGTQVVSASKKRFHDVSSHYAPGFRFDWGWDLPCICWDADVVWTHFDSQNTSRQRLGFRGGVNGFTAIPFYRDSESELTLGQKGNLVGSLNFKLDVVDLEFGKWLDCDDCLQFRPFIGLRAVNVREKFHAEVDVYSTFAEGSQVARKARMYNEFKGAGLLAGLDTEWHLCGEWSLVGRMGASLVWGYTKVRNQFTQYNQVLVGDIDYTSRETDHYRFCRAFTDLSLGIRYRSCICCCPVDVGLAWEHHLLFNQHRFFASDIAASEGGFNFKKKGDLSLQGLTVSAGLEF